MSATQDLIDVIPEMNGHHCYLVVAAVKELVVARDTAEQEVDRERLARDRLRRKARRLEARAADLETRLDKAVTHLGLLVDVGLGRRSLSPVKYERLLDDADAVRRELLREDGP